MNHSPTIKEVLKRPLFQYAEVIAGHKGISKTVRWTHILETPEGTSFLNGGELILSTGAGFGESSTKRISYLLDLIQKEAAGLCIELGTYMPCIPQDMREVADHHEFPIITFTKPVRFVDITQNLHEGIVYRHLESMRELEEYSREIQKLTLESQSLHKILQRFQGLVQTQAFYLHTDQTVIFSPAMSHNTQHEMTRLLNQLLLSEHPGLSERRILSISEQKQVLFQPISAMGQVFAYLGIVLFDRQPDHFLLLTLDYTASTMAQLLLRKMFVEERLLDHQNRLLDDILENIAGHEDEIRAQLGIRNDKNATASYTSIILEIDPEKIEYSLQRAFPFDDVQGIFRSIFSRHGFQVLMRSKGNRLYILAISLNLFTRDIIQKLLKELNHTFKQAVDSAAELRFGIGRQSKQFSKANQHFQEAEQALKFPSNSPCCFFEDLGVYRLLIQLNTGYALPSFIEDYLDPLIKHDREQGSELLHTLKIYFESNLSKQDAADRLFIRRQTLYHRLEKIEELLGDNYLNPHQRLCLELAIKAYEWKYRQKNI